MLNSGQWVALKIFGPLEGWMVTFKSFNPQADLSATAQCAIADYTNYVQILTTVL
jgi:hypothetical protein